MPTSVAWSRSGTKSQALLEKGPEHESYSIRRRLFFIDKLIRFCGWHNDTVVRLVKKGSARYPNRRVHADMVTRGPSPRLDHPMDHYMIHDPAEYIRRITKYGVWGAAQMWKEGRKAGVTEFFGRSLWRFFRAYFVQLGFLDGAHGLMFCIIQAYGTFREVFAGLELAAPREAGAQAQPAGVRRGPIPVARPRRGRWLRHGRRPSEGLSRAPTAGEGAVHITVILSTYNAPDLLEKVLCGYAVQDHPTFDIVVADDGSGPETRELIEAAGPRLDLRIHHVWHEDDGFRKCAILNKAVTAAQADYLLFSDGDCIPRQDFLSTHARLASPGRFLSGGYYKLPRTVSEAITPEDVLGPAGPRSAAFSAPRAYPGRRRSCGSRPGHGSDACWTP